MRNIRSIPGLKKFYEERSQDVRDYFEHVPGLLGEFPLSVCLAYVFAELERGQNMALYCGLVRIYNIESNFARNIVSNEHINRSSFISFYTTIFSKNIPKGAQQDLEKAEKTRDAVMHGKPANDDRIRNAIACVLEYAEIINEELNIHKFTPFGDLRGFAGGRKNYLDKKKSQFLLKGIGFSLRQKKISS